MQCGDTAEICSLKIVLSINGACDSYGPLLSSLGSSQEDEAHVQMSTRRDKFHLLNDACFVFSPAKCPKNLKPNYCTNMQNPVLKFFNVGLMLIIVPILADKSCQLCTCSLRCRNSADSTPAKQHISGQRAQTSYSFPNELTVYKNHFKPLSPHLQS